MLLARSTQGCLQPVLHLLDLPHHPQDPTAALRRECFTRASPRALHPPFPRPYPTTPPSRCLHCSCRARVALRSSTTLCPGWEQRLCMLWRSPTSKTLNTAGCCHAHGLFPYRDGTPPRQGPRKTLCSGAPSTIHQSFNTGRDMVADATDTVPRVQHGPLGFGQSWRTRNPPQARELSPQLGARDQISHPTAVPGTQVPPAAHVTLSVPHRRGCGRSGEPTWTGFTHPMPTSGCSPGAALADPSPSSQSPGAARGLPGLIPPHPNPRQGQPLGCTYKYGQVEEDHHDLDKGEAPHLCAWGEWREIIRGTPNPGTAAALLRAGLRPPPKEIWGLPTGKGGGGGENPTGVHSPKPPSPAYLSGEQLPQPRPCPPRPH